MDWGCANPTPTSSALLHTIWEGADFYILCAQVPMPAGSHLGSAKSRHTGGESDGGRKGEARISPPLPLATSLKAVSPEAHCQLLLGDLGSRNPTLITLSFQPCVDNGI